MSEPTVITTTDNNTPNISIQIKQGKPLGISFETRINDLKKEGTGNQKKFISEIESYIEQMAPGVVIDFETGSRYQYKLWKSLEYVLVKSPREEFNALWNLVLLYFSKYGNDKDVLGDRFVYRFASAWNHSQTELTNLQKTLNLIRLTADPITRSKNLREVNLNLTFGEDYPQEAGERLAAFYHSPY